MGIVLIDFVRKPVDVMYPHLRMLDLSLYNSILSKPIAIYYKGEIPAKVALCIEVSYSSKLYPIPFESQAKQGSKGQPSLGGAWGVPTLPFSRGGEESNALRKILSCR